VFRYSRLISAATVDNSPVRRTYGFALLPCETATIAGIDLRNRWAFFASLRLHSGKEIKKNLCSI